MVNNNLENLSEKFCGAINTSCSDDDSADPNNNVTNVSEPEPTPAKKT
jgi:hypothetical protein